MNVMIARDDDYTRQIRVEKLRRQLPQKVSDFNVLGCNFGVEIGVSILAPWIRSPLTTTRSGQGIPSDFHRIASLKIAARRSSLFRRGPDVRCKSEM